jgi:hypothetical protein
VHKRCLRHESAPDRAHCPDISLFRRFILQLEAARHDGPSVLAAQPEGAYEAFSAGLGYAASKQRFERGEASVRTRGVSADRQHQASAQLTNSCEPCRTVLGFQAGLYVGKKR